MEEPVLTVLTVLVVHELRSVIAPSVQLADLLSLKVPSLEWLVARSGFRVPRVPNGHHVFFKVRYVTGTLIVSTSVLVTGKALVTRSDALVPSSEHCSAQIPNTVISVCFR